MGKKNKKCAEPGEKGYLFTDGAWHLCVFAPTLKEARKHTGEMKYLGKRHPEECPEMTCGCNAYNS